MAFVSEALLDNLEVFFTKKAKRWQNKPPPRWIAFLQPSLLLRPNEKYTRQLYWHEATIPGVSVVFLESLTMFAVVAYLWHKCPWLFTNPQYHRPFIGWLSHEGFYQTPLAFVFLLTFSYLIHFPRYYFWNRRATRLQANPGGQKEPAMIAVIDPSVWPPPPNRSPSQK